MTVWVRQWSLNVQEMEIVILLLWKDRMEYLGFSLLSRDLVKVGLWALVRFARFLRTD